MEASHPRNFRHPPRPLRHERRNHLQTVTRITCGDMPQPVKTSLDTSAFISGNSNAPFISSMRPIFILFFFFVSRFAQSQSACPAVQFQGTATALASPTSSSHIVVTRQLRRLLYRLRAFKHLALPDHSHHSEKTPRPSTPACPPEARAPRSLHRPLTSATLQAPGSQSAAYAVLPSGNYLSAASNGCGTRRDRVRPKYDLVSENMSSLPFSSVRLRRPE